MTPNYGVTSMFGHYLKYPAAGSIQHSNIPPTTRGLYDRNCGSNPREGGFLLSEDSFPNSIFCPQEELQGTRSNDTWAEGDFRADRDATGLGGNECDQSSDLETDPRPTFGWRVHTAIIGALIVATAAWYALGYLTVRVFHFIVAVTR